MGRTNRWFGVAVFFSLCAAPRPAHGYTIENLVGSGCHEEITAAALRAVRKELPTAAPLPADENEQALIDDLQFSPDADMHDLGGATLLAAVRDNDLKGRSSGDLTQLAGVHGNPDGQEEHCLRSADQDEPSGSQAAVAACRVFLRGRIVEALGGLDGSGKPDPTKRTTLTIHLSLRGKVDAPLPTYYVKMGQAIHAIEDSFSHTYRTPDETQITVVLNWIDKVDGTLVESRDGPAHAALLDHCDDADKLRTSKHMLAIAAVTGVLRATLDPQKSSDEKMTAVDAVLDTYMTYSPGCTFDNGWCQAPERQYADSNGCGCHVAGGGNGPRIGLGRHVSGSAGEWSKRLGWAACCLLCLRRTRRRSSHRSAAALALMAGCFLSPRIASAQTTTTTIPASQPSIPPTQETVVQTPTTTTTTVTAPTTPDTHEPPPPKIIPVQEPLPRDPTATAWGASFNLSGSIDNPALAGALGLRLHASKQWSFGLDAEWNPWLALNGTTFHAGAFNVYGSGILRFPLAYENFNLRTTLSLGVSYLLTNLYGAPSGSTGLYADVSFLGVEWKLSRTFLFLVNPLNIALPVPQIHGVPLAYTQYRFTLGLEMYFN